MHKTQRRARKYLRPLVLSVLLSLFVYASWYGVGAIRRFVQTTGIDPITVVELFFSPLTILKQSEGRVNVLALGVPGGSYAGSDLTDTILVLSIDTKNGYGVSMISVPRDIWSDDLKDKVNSAYSYGEQKKKDSGGIVLSKAVMESVVGLPIHYVLVIDFAGFERFIDTIGGIDVDVKQPFVDPSYPIAGKENDDCSGDPDYSCRYMELVFEQGLEHMDGARALMYVRSRHANGSEGTDFARGRRQQDVLLAIKQKMVQEKLWFNVSVLRDMYTVVSDAVHTNMRIGELMALGRVLMGLEGVDVKRISLEPYLINPPSWQYDRYVLIPSESFEDIHQNIAEQLQ